MFYGHGNSTGLNKRNHHCHKALDEPILDGDMRYCKGGGEFFSAVNDFANAMEVHAGKALGGYKDFPVPASPNRATLVLYTPGSIWVHLRYDRGCIDLYSYEMKIACMELSKWIPGDRTLFSIRDVPSVTTRRHLSDMRRVRTPYSIEVPTMPYIEKLDANDEEKSYARTVNERVREQTMAYAIEAASEALKRSRRARTPRSIACHYGAAVGELGNACAMDVWVGMKHKWVEVPPEDIYPEVVQAKMALEGYPMTDLSPLGYPSDIFNPVEVLTR